MGDLWLLQQCHPWLDIVIAVKNRLGDGPGRGPADEVIARQALLRDLSTAYLAGPATMVEPALQVRTAARLAPVQVRDDLAALTASVTGPAFDRLRMRRVPPLLRQP